MDYETSYAKWITRHRISRTGERLRRLVDGFNEPEQMLLREVIYPVVGTLHDLHPEFEVKVFRKPPFFIDIALIRGPLKIGFELEGYGPHQRDVDRYQFAYDRRRHLWLLGEGWVMLYFPFSDIKDRLEELQSYVRRALRRLEYRGEVLSVHEREVIRIALASHRQIIKVSRVTKHLELGRDKTRELLREMEKKDLLSIMGDAPKHIHRYRLNGEHPQIKQFVSGI